MRLTTLTDYALRLLMYVAQHPDRLCTIAEVADAYGISEAHLMKVTHQLGLTGWIETVRGKGGGMRLALPAADIRLGELVRSIEPDFSVAECFATGQCCVPRGHCELSHVIDGALQTFLAHLDAHTLADVLPGPTAPTRPRNAPVRVMRRKTA